MYATCCICESEAHMKLECEILNCRFFFLFWSGARSNSGVSLCVSAQYYWTESNLACIVRSRVAELGGAPLHNALTVNTQLPVCHKSQASTQTRHCQKLHILSKCGFSTKGALRTDTLVFLGTSWNRCEHMRMPNLDCRFNARSRPPPLLSRIINQTVLWNFTRYQQIFSHTFSAWSKDKAARG